jgi:hypothetical protein
MAAVLQARWRGYRTRAWYKTWKPQQMQDKLDKAASYIQSAYRGLLQRRQLGFMIFGAKQEALSRGLLSKRPAKKRTLDGLPRWKKENEAATRIQRLLRAKKNNR